MIVFNIFTPTGGDDHDPKLYPQAAGRSHPDGVRRPCPGRHYHHLVRYGRAGLRVLQARHRRMGPEDRQLSEAGVHSHRPQRHSGPVPQAVRRQVVGHGRRDAGRGVARHDRQSPDRPHPLRQGRGEEALPRHHHQQHGEGETGGHALVHRGRHAVLPQGSSGKVQAARTQDLGRVRQDRCRHPGRRAQGRQQRLPGLCLAGQGL